MVLMIINGTIQKYNFQANPDKKIFFKYPKLCEDYKYYCSIHSTESS